MSINRPEDTYTREELDRLIDYLVAFPVSEFDGFVQYRIGDVYVSGSVVAQALSERLEKMVSKE